MVEGARLEIWCGARPHLGFESLSLRKKGFGGLHLKSITLFDIFIFALERCPSGRRCTIGSRVRSKAFGGSNPPLSVWGQILRCRHHPTPPGPGGSNGKWHVGETQGICPLFFLPKRKTRKKSPGSKSFNCSFQRTCTDAASNTRWHCSPTL